MVLQLANRAWGHLRERLNTPSVSFISFDDAFPNIDKHAAYPRETIPTPEAPHMDTWYMAAHLTAQPVYTTPEIFTALVPNALYSPENGALVTPDRRVVSESVQTERFLRPMDPQALKASRITPLSGYCTSLRGFNSNYYHTIIDNLPRLTLLNREPYRSLPEIKVLCLPEAPSRVERFFLRKLLPPNARLVPVEPGQLYCVEKYLFASFLSRRGAAYLPRDYMRYFHDRFLPRRPSTRSERIFISRAGTRWRRLLNEEEVVAFLERRGFTSYRLEDLPFEKEIEVMYDADAVVAPHGSGLTNLIFSKPLPVIEIFPSQTIFPHFYYLSKACGHRHAYLCAGMQHRDADYRVDLKQLETLLNRQGIC